jgi:hypothetical protein
VPANDTGLVAREDPIDEILAEVELAPELAQAFDLHLEILGLLMRPWHPRPQMVEAGVERNFQQRRV